MSISDSDEHLNLRSEPTDVRFSTRSLLIAMALVPIVILALSAFIRQFPADARPLLVVHWCVFGVLVLIAIGYMARQRYMVEQQAGPVRFVLATHSYLAPGLPAIARILLASFTIIAGISMWGVQSFLMADNNRPLWSLWWVLFNWQSYMAVIVTTTGIAYLWWYRSVRVCDGGVIVRHQLLPWAQFQRWHWDAVHRDIIVLSHSPRVALIVPAENHAALEAFVSSRV